MMLLCLVSAYCERKSLGCRVQVGLVGRDGEAVHQRFIHKIITFILNSFWRIR